MSKDYDERILHELQQIKKLLALTLINEQSQTDQIKALSQAGFQPKDIAELIGTTANTVRVSLSAIKLMIPRQFPYHLWYFVK